MQKAPKWLNAHDAFIMGLETSSMSGRQLNLYCLRAGISVQQAKFWQDVACEEMEESLSHWQRHIILT